ncbi:MAG: hypothetical protein R6W99_03555, partial [Clostridia bacterium]
MPNNLKMTCCQAFPDYTTSPLNQKIQYNKKPCAPDDMSSAEQGLGFTMIFVPGLECAAMTASLDSPAEMTEAYFREFLSNIAMVDLLKIRAERLQNCKLDDFNKKIMLDSQPSHLPVF